MSELSTTALDRNGIQRLLNDNIRDLQFVDVSSSEFANPSAGYTGYAANGYWYFQGALRPLEVPYKALWAQEGEGAPSLHRGDLDSFPDRILVVTTDVEVVLLDADSLDVWMRFVLLLGPAGGAYGNFLGGPATEIYQARFCEGYLVVATSAGLRVADFRQDRGTVHAQGDSMRSRYKDDGAPYVGLSLRNADEYLEYAPLAASADLADDVTSCCAVAPVGDSVVAALGTPTGLAALVLYEGALGVPTAKTHATFSQDYAASGGRALDDADGDAVTPYFTDDPRTWESDGVRPGDVLALPGSSHRVVEVTDQHLEVVPELSVTALEDDYTIFRPVSAVLVRDGGVLYYANGTTRVARESTEDWYTGPGLLDPFGASANGVPLHSLVTAVHCIVPRGTDYYVGTDLGVFFAPDASFDTQTAAELRYAASEGSVAVTYPVLEGVINEVVALAVDPETGHVLVAATDEAASCVTEIDVSIHQAFRYFATDDLGGTVNALAAFRNPQGPPDAEVS